MLFWPFGEGTNVLRSKEFRQKNLDRHEVRLAQSDGSEAAKISSTVLLFIFLS